MHIIQGWTGIELDPETAVVDGVLRFDREDLMAVSLSCKGSSL